MLVWIPVTPRVFAWGLGLGLWGLTGCDTRSPSECHRELVNRLGCCPTCDGDCRETIASACAELHDEPLVELEPEPEDELEPEDEPPAEDTGLGPDPDDDEPRPR